MQIIVDGLLTNYQISDSSKPSILMLHGWGSSSEAFKNLSLGLVKNYNVIALDLPGMGGSEAPNATWDLNDYKKFIVDFLAKLKIGSLYAILGHSNGGSLAIKIAADQKLITKLKIKKLILIGSAGVRDKDRLKKKTFWIVAKGGKIFTSFLPSSVQLKLKRKLYSAAGSEALDNPILEKTFRKVVAEDIQSIASDVKLKSLLIYGDDDRDTPVSYGQILADLIPNSKLEIVKHAGHYVFLDQPEMTLSLVEDFLNAN